jgi:hypothetical protein
MQTLKTQAMKSIFTMRKCRYQKFGESFQTIQAIERKEI